MSHRVLGALRAGASGAVSRLKTMPDRTFAATRPHEAPLAETAQPTTQPLAQRRQELLAFYGYYEDLVAVLCDAAQYGPTPRLESDYRTLRCAVHRSYATIRPYVVAFLRYNSEDARYGIHLWGRSADAFEALVCAPTLHDALRADDGWMISRITRTRDALNLYGELLRAQFTESGDSRQA